VINEALRRALIAMRDEDLSVREELLEAGRLGGRYVPRMEEVHRGNAARLREIIAQHGWPTQDITGEDGAQAAWLVVQHAVGEPEFQRAVLGLMQALVAQERAPAWHAAYLEDRIALHEGRPQRYGSQWIDDARDGRTRPWKLAEPERIDELRASVGLAPLPPIPELGPDLPPEQQERLRSTQRWWEEWFASKGWRS
jgi:hypothetical protein